MRINCNFSGAQRHETVGQLFYFIIFIPQLQTVYCSPARVEHRAAALKLAEF